jgi:membrane-bound serine protease (ClpP class)
MLAVILLTRLPKTRLRLGGMILSTAITGRSFQEEPSSGEKHAWVGRTGTAVTNLRPVGVGEFDGERTDVICEAGHLPKGTPIIVTKAKGYQKIVRAVSEEE